MTLTISDLLAVAAVTVGPVLIISFGVALVWLRTDFHALDRRFSADIARLNARHRADFARLRADLAKQNSRQSNTGRLPKSSPDV